MKTLAVEKKKDYIEGLDGIRALAAFLVVFTHWPNNFLSLKFGWIGVNIFFVLSGFLITRILVQTKEKSFKEYIGHFYYKRALRIFPLYYAFLIGGFILIKLITHFYPLLLSLDSWKGAYNAVTHDFPYYLTYTYNLKINLRYFIHWPDSSNKFFGHLWSLCVEEQFYLIFPFVIYFSSLKSLKRIIVAILVICPLIRLWTSIYGIHLVSDHYWLGELLYSNTFCQADALTTGAALAVFNFKLAKPYFTFLITLLVWLFVGMLSFYFLRKAGYFLVEGKSLGYNFPGFWFDQPSKYFLLNIRAFYQYSLVNLLAVALILPSINGKPLFPKFFLNPFVSYLGKISYGIYVFHNPVGAMFQLVGDIKGGWFKLTENHLVEMCCFLVYVTIVVGVAHLSYQYFEKRILAYKTRIA